MTLKQAIVATLAYHDIFTYPLTSQQTHSYLIQKATLDSVEENLKDLQTKKQVFSKNDYLYLKGRGAIVKTRESRLRNSASKLKRANFYASIIKFIPSVQLVALTGALSMQNSDREDDIDIMVITSKNTLWTTRLLVNLALLNYKRKPGEPHTKNKACLNIFLSENSLRVSTQNLYTAHEVAQVKPIWQRGNIYQHFTKANSWVKRYLPNWQPYPLDVFNTNKQSRFSAIASGILSVAEPIAKFVQLRYMHRRITSEKIGDTQLFFHPGNTQQYVLGKYEAKLKSLR